MSEEILAQYGNTTIYTEETHPSPIYHVDGDVEDNPYGKLQPLLEDDDLVAAALARGPIDLFDQLVVSDLVDGLAVVADDLHETPSGARVAGL